MPNVNGSPVRILFVERSSELREIYQSLFEVYGCMVQMACTGEEAVQAAQAYRPHAVYSSLVLPGMNGFELAAHLRKIDVMRDVVLIALTGYAANNIEKLVQDAGFDCYLLKPISLHKLLLPLTKIPDFLASEAIQTLYQEIQNTPEHCAYAAFRSRALGGY